MIDWRFEVLEPFVCIGFVDTQIIEKYPAVKDIKEEIMGSKTLIEAIEKVDAFKSTDSAVIKIEEKVKSGDTSWLGGRN